MQILQNLLSRYRYIIWNTLFVFLNFTSKIWHKLTKLKIPKLGKYNIPKKELAPKLITVN